MKAIIYIRKSTESDDKQAQSLELQLEWCQSYVDQNDIYIVETIIESKSAFKTKGREGFGKLVEHFENGNADTLIVYQLDRICRNPLDEGNIKWLTQQGKIKRIISSQGIFDGRQILTLSLFLAMANQYSIDHSFRVVKGMEKTINKGRLLGPAPLGYTVDYNHDKKAKKNNYAAHIKRIFEMKSDGMSYRLITEQINEEGFKTKKGAKVSQTVVERIIKNPFYYGMILYKGELFKGEHEGIISKELYDTANSFGRGVIIVKNDDLSPLKGIVKHFETGDKLTCSLIKKKYVYFHIHSRKNNSLWINQNLIIEHFDKIIGDYCIPIKYSEELKKEIHNEYQEELSDNRDYLIETKNSIKRFEGKIERIREMREDQEITSEEFKRDKAKYLNEIEVLTDRLIKLNRDYSTFLDNLDSTVELFVNLKDKRKRLGKYGVKEKLELIKNIVVEIKIDNKKGLYIEENTTFKVLRSVNCNEWGTECCNGLTNLARYFLNNKEEVLQLYKKLLVS